MSLLLLSSRRQSAPPGTVKRRGLVQGTGHVVRDDDGIFHPLGVTLFWALYGWKFERDRILAHLAFLSGHGFDYVRILGEVDWVGRSIDPPADAGNMTPLAWADYTPMLQQFVDCAYDQYGLRSEISIIGGRPRDEVTGVQRFVPTDLARVVAEAMVGREHKVMHFEMANEWQRLDKATPDDLMAMCQVVVEMSPNLVALSCPAETSSTTFAAIENATGVEPTSAELEDGIHALLNLASSRSITFWEAAKVLRAALSAGGDLKGLLGKRYHEGLTLLQILRVVRELYGPDVDTQESTDSDGFDEMILATQTAGGNCYTPHLRRSDHDYKWSHVRQGYDLRLFPDATSNNEPQGPQSSVDTLDDPLQLACARLLGVMCGGAPYVLHVGQGVTGEADPNHGRPQNMWEVPNIDTIMTVVRQVDVLLPEGVENWDVVNNGRSNHPLPLDAHKGFWEGSDGNAPAVNKNYAALSGNQFVMMLTGCRSVEETGPVPAGTAIRAMHVAAYDPVTLAIVAEADLEKGQSWTVPGRHDTMAGYLVRGTYR